MDEPIQPYRGHVRRARKTHPCASYSEQDEQGYTYYSTGAHDIEPGETYVHARLVYPAGIDSFDGEAYPMCSVDLRMCSYCASSRGYISNEDEHRMEQLNLHVRQPEDIAAS